MSERNSKGWWDRNWYWAIPSGCLGCFGLLISSCAVMIGGIFGSIRGSEPFEEVLDRARENPRVIEALGEPIKVGWAVSGSFSIGDGNGKANLTVPISGPKGEAELHVVAHRDQDEWIYEVMTVRLESTGATIDLLTDQPTPDRSVEKASPFMHSRIVNAIEFYMTGSRRPGPNRSTRCRPGWSRSGTRRREGKNPSLSTPQV